jgi:DNA-binding NarL/FixJ family response regulator
MTIRMLICDDQADVRKGLMLMFRLEADIDVVGMAGSGAEAIELSARLAPDLVLMDLKMPAMNGIEATRRILGHAPALKVLVLTTYHDNWVFDAIQAGAAGYILKDSPREDLLTAVRGTVAGRSYIDPAVAGQLMRKISTPSRTAASQLADKLSERELDVLKLLTIGASTAGIAAHLHLSEGTVRNNISAILSKLEVADRIQAVVLALQHGLTP